MNVCMHVKFKFTIHFVTVSLDRQKDITQNSSTNPTYLFNNMWYDLTYTEETSKQYNLLIYNLPNYC